MSPQRQGFGSACCGQVWRPAHREAWIAEHARSLTWCQSSALVETGLDLFSRGRPAQLPHHLLLRDRLQPVHAGGITAIVAHR